MSNRKSSGGYTAATAIKVILLILAVVIILAAAVFGAYYLSNGFGGKYATFATTVNGKLVLSSGSIQLPRGSELKIASFSDYTLKVVAAEPEQDFALTIGGEMVNYSDLAGEDLTAGFTFTESDGAITVEYGSMEEILSAAMGTEVAINETPDDELFTLVITSGESVLNLDFAPASFASDYKIVLDPDHIIFYGDAS